MAHKFDVRKAELLDSPDRLQILNPDTILDKLGLNRETMFADLGCGTGYFSLPAALRVSKVYALDVQEKMLEILQNKIKKEKIKNIDIILSRESSIPLPDNSIDILFMANVFHELQDKKSILSEAKRILSSGGKLTIIDWKKMEMDFGPPLGERLTEDEVVSACKNNGFEILEKAEAGPYNYILIFKVRKNSQVDKDRINIDCIYIN
ncbi:putative cobalt-precorrin-6B C(15)-methyltransferase (decarboxylating) [uncultured archaeon]|nr:putative cobalt-precorrin-6B C(15)-methyltransferase (decarboxylating) [uncultured archaeon]